MTDIKTSVRAGGGWGRWWRSLTLLMLLVGLTLTAIATVIVKNSSDRMEQLRFSNYSAKLATHATDRLQSYSGLLDAAAGFSAAQPDMTDAQFQTFASSLNLEAYPGAVTIGYVVRVRREELEAYVQAAKKERPGFLLKSASSTGDLMIIRYVKPGRLSPLAVGFDLGSEPVRREAAEQAMDTGHKAMTRLVQLLQVDGTFSGVLYMRPIYRGGTTPSTVEARREALVGWVYMPIRMDHVFTGVSDRLDRQVDFELFKGTKVLGDNLLYDEDDLLAGHSNDFMSAEFSRRRFVSRQPIAIDGQDWTLLTSSLPEFDRGGNRMMAWLVAIPGIIFSALLALLVGSIARSRQRAEDMAASVTRELAQRNEELGRACEAAIESARTKSEFVANMSHEIRTPLTAILGYSELLMEESIRLNATEQCLNAINTIRRNGTHLLAVINDILDLSKIEAGKMTVSLVEISPLDIANEVIALLQPRASEKSLDLNLVVTYPLPKHWKTDPVRVRQILVNLVGNALKFTTRGSVTLRLEYDANTAALRFDVADTGIGISEELRERLFQPFTQVDSSSSRRFGGTGLGLHISRRLAEMLGGTISVVSVPQEGSTFTLSFAVSPAPSADELIAPHKQNTPEPAESVQHTKLNGRVLVAEDGADNQRLIAFLLTRAGLSVDFAANGVEAVAAVEAAARNGDPFDLVLMDIQMPEMDGYEATSLLRQRGYKMPIVALTANAMLGDREESLTAGCTAYLAKPINHAQLIEVCRMQLASQSAAGQ